MSLSKSVQFTSVDGVVNNYTEQGIPDFALFNGKQMLSRYNGGDLQEGADILEKIIRGYDASRSMAVYTVCLYDRDPKQKTLAIKSTTPYDVSFNFRFHTQSEEYISGLGGHPREIFPLWQKQLEELKQEIKELREEREDLLAEIQERDAVPAGNLDAITGLLNNPMVAGLIGKLLGTPATAPALSGPDQPQAEEEKLSRALEILVQADPLIGTHLLKLATVAVNDRAKFANLIAMLDLL
jgi:hypothetical protein